ncbi:MAG: hypothetical protein P8J37_00805 [Fuerstiella sp.]|nr:hypothetical protein [Fuerstiella sp.]
MNLPMFHCLFRTIPSLCLIVYGSAAFAADAIDIGSRRELFVDRYLIDSMSNSVQLQVQQPEAQEVVLVTGEPWEGNTCAYYSIFQDEDIYRMYYRGSHAIDMKAAHPEVTCYAESKDGIHWTKPKLGLYEWGGSKENNIVWNGIGTHCFVAFRDANPECSADARYKAISRGRPQGEKGLYVFKSPDAIHWSLIKDEPVITDGYFDSQNLAFWDPVTKQYVDYHRTFINKVRSILMCTSDDFVTWSTPVALTYPDTPHQHLYTNAIRPYPSAPHIRIGFPTRYMPKTQQVEPVFMSSRDGITFQRFSDAIIPQTAPADRDGNRSNYMTNGLLELPGQPDELSVYATEAYYTGPDSRVRRFTYRKDGFVALNGTGEVLTRPLVFDGAVLSLNYRCASAGSVIVQLCDSDGVLIPGFECAPLGGDNVDHRIRWTSGQTSGKLAGQEVRLRLTLNNADVFAFQFVVQ